MKLIGLYDSPYVRRVAVTMRLYGMDYEQVALSVFRHQEEMRKINPMMKVPMLVLDDGEKLSDSSFIIDYLDGEAAPGCRLTPAGGPQRRRVLQHCALALQAVEKAVQIVYDTSLRPREFSYAPWVERCTAQMHTGFALLDQLPAATALSGGPLTQGDVTAAVAFRFARHMLPAEVPEGRYPNLDKLSAWCESLPAFVAIPLE